MDKLTIFTAADSNYELQVRVFIESICRSQTQPTKVIVLGNGWTTGKIAKLKDMEKAHVSIEVRSVEISQIKEIQLSHGFPYATAYNVIAPKFLLSEYTRLLYMDADIVVLKDLSDLWNSKLTHPVGAVLDSHIAWIGSPSMWRPWKEENLDPKLPYLNTGVMLIDVELWNTNHITEKTFSLLKKYQLPCVDQDALNLVLAGRFDSIDLKYNLMPYHLLKKFRYIDVVIPNSQIESAIDSPVAIHFHRSFLGKPWLWGSTHPATKLWRDIADDAFPKWKKGISLFELIRNFGARRVGLLDLDSSAGKLAELQLKKVS